MKPRAFLILAVALIVTHLIAGAIAQTPNSDRVTAIDLSGVADGQYVLTVSGSQITIVPLTLIRPNTPTPPDPDPDLNARAKKFQAATIAVTGDADKATTTAAMSELYRQLGKAVLDKGISDYQIIGQIVKMAEKQVLEKQNAVTAWKPVTDLSSNELAAVAATSGTSAGDYAACLVDAAEGLDATVDQQIDPAWIELIMQIIKIILELLIK